MLIFRSFLFPHCIGICRALLLNVPITGGICEKARSNNQSSPMKYRICEYGKSIRLFLMCRSKHKPLGSIAIHFSGEWRILEHFQPTRWFGLNCAHSEFIIINNSAARNKKFVNRLVWIDGVGSSCHWLEVMAMSHEFSELKTTHCGLHAHVPKSNINAIRFAEFAMWISRAIRVRVQSTY